MEQQEIKSDKLTDKAFSRLMLTSVLGILLCIACLCSATWAWFSTDVSSDQNTLSAGNFDLVVSVQELDSAPPVSVDGSADGAYFCSLNGGRYSVSISISQDTTVTKGYCIITVNGVPYKTAPLVAGETDTISFTLDVSDAQIGVFFDPSWGLPAHYDVENGGTLVIGQRTSE